MRKMKTGRDVHMTRQRIMHKAQILLTLSLSSLSYSASASVPATVVYQNDWTWISYSTPIEAEVAYHAKWQATFGKYSCGFNQWTWTEATSYFYAYVPCSQDCGCGHGVPKVYKVYTCPTNYINDPNNQSICILPPGEAEPEKSNVGAPSTCMGNPCDAGTGYKYQTETDYIGTGPFPLVLTRAYNSGGTTPSVVEETHWGSHWNAGVDRAVIFTTGNTTASIRRADAKEFFFNLVNGVWVGDGDELGKLSYTKDANGAVTGWTYVTAGNDTEAYNAKGQLVSETNLAGFSQTFTYDGSGRLETVSDPAGRSLTFFYDSSNRVNRVTDPAGGAYLYAYDANNNLSQVTYPDGKTRQYRYGEAALVSSAPNAGVTYIHSLTGIIDENGKRYASWSYDAAGRATSSEHGATGSGIDHVGLAYNEPDADGKRITQVTDVRGVTRDYTFSTIQGVVKNTGIVGVPCNGCTASYGYDDNGNTTRRTDFNGNSSCTSYDSARNLPLVSLSGVAGEVCPTDLTSYSPSGLERKTTTQWHAQWRLPEVIAEPLRLTHLRYDEQGRLIESRVEATSDSTGADGINASVVGDAQISSFHYVLSGPGVGQLESVDGPRLDVSDVVNYQYDDQGNLITVSNALGHSTQLSNFDAHGRVQTITDANGLTSTMRYDPRGRLQTLNRGGLVTTYQYDGVGNLEQVDLPSGAKLVYRYDQAHRLTDLFDADGNQLHYVLDEAGNRTHEEVRDAAGNVLQQHSRVFNELNRLQQDIGALNQTTEFEYDNVGNLTKITDPLQHSTVHHYDLLNRIINSTDADNQVTQYGYDHQDQLTSVTDARNLTTRYTINGLGQTSLTHSPDTGDSTRLFDSAGNVKQSTDAKGQISEYQYDALNRLTHINYPADPTQNVVYQYDQGSNGIGHLSQITDASGSTSYQYDQQGRLTQQTTTLNGKAHSTGYRYDSQGRLDQITYPSGRLVNYQFDNQGRIRQITSTGQDGEAKVVADQIQYHPFGGVKQFTFGNGQVYQRTLDQDGRIHQVSQGKQLQTLGYDDASRLTSVSASNWPTATYGYDNVDRLIQYSQNASNQSFSYDAVGNRRSKTVGAATTSYQYDTDSNQLASTQQGNQQAQSWQFDANGSTTQDPSKQHQYQYDVRGRLIKTQTAYGTVNYRINALGQRVRKQSANTDMSYLYGPGGQLLAEKKTYRDEYSAEYLYLGGLLISVFK